MSKIMIVNVIEREDPEKHYGFFLTEYVSNTDGSLRFNPVKSRENLKKLPPNGEWGGDCYFLSNKDYETVSILLKDEVDIKERPDPDTPSADLPDDTVLGTAEITLKDYRWWLEGDPCRKRLDKVTLGDLQTLVDSHIEHMTEQAAFSSVEHVSLILQEKKYDRKN